MADNSIDSTKRYEVVTDKNGREFRRTVAHLPHYYRTDANEKFLSSTLDPAIQKGKLDRLDGYIGRLDSYTRSISDNYLNATTKSRTQYQLEPTVTISDIDTSSIAPEDRIKFSATYDDLINQLGYFNAPVDNHDRLTKEKTYSWNPYVDLDKLVNFREYYWLPNGPAAILVDKIAEGSTTEIAVTVPKVGVYRFSTYEAKDNPAITLYRGNTYKFKIDAEGHPFYFMTEPVSSGLASDGSTSIVYTKGVANSGADKGTITFTVPSDAPDSLFYQCGNHGAMHGVVKIKTATSTTKIEVAEDILGAVNYTMCTGTVLSNGMKIRFGSNVIDTEKYGDKSFYVEGVGSKITLTDVDDLITPETYATETTILYDSVGFDSRPYAKSFYRPDKHDYITIKRDSIDQNAWSRYNRWFHKSVIEATAKANGSEVSLQEDDRAKRPIIEFDSNLQLFNYGSVAKKSVALVDDVTTDVFSSMVNQTGYYVDGVEVTNGMRVLFTADTDKLVKNKIYEVQFVKVQGSTVIALQLAEINDTYPVDGEQVYVEFGTKNQGKTLHFSTSAGPDRNESKWIEGQKKTKLNQQPLFDVFDKNGKSFSDDTVYSSTNFAGSELFSYKISDGATEDTVLGLKVKYNTINNVGDLVFESDVNSGTFRYKSGDDFIVQSSATGFTHEITGLLTYNNRTNWKERLTESKQRVRRTHFATATEKKLFPIDVYKDSATLTDLEVSVKVNGVSKKVNTDYTLVNGTSNRYVKFSEDLELHDIVSLLCWSNSTKVAEVGSYEIPDILSNNPLNGSLDTFTLGQISNHIINVSNRSTDITGTIPGPTNLRDKPESFLTGGALQHHTGSITSAMFNLIDKEANFCTALDYANLEYQKFKETFLTQATGTTYSGNVADRVDEILNEMAFKKTPTSPFYYEDMLGFGTKVSERKYTVQDPSATEYSIDSIFDMTTLSNRAVYVYKNDVQLIHGTDYTFSTTVDSVNFVSTLATGDIIKIKEYSNTEGSYIPPTPTKLGMYPKFTPSLEADNTYRTSQNVIVGHDGSRTIAYGDYRDDLLLELEKRIYNNIKSTYNNDLLNVHSVMPGAFRTNLFTRDEFNGVMSEDFYVWAGRNNVDFRANTGYTTSDIFTYNYSSSKDVNGKDQEAGYWRGIFNYYFDTDRPHTHPWEMLGHSEKPSTWESKYGPGPYTSGNEVLWSDIERGYDATTKQIDVRYARPGLSNKIPVNSSGTMANPATIVGKFERVNIKQPWKFGDHGPAETAWRRSSSFAFAVIKALAILQPSKFFGTYLDSSRLSKNSVGNYVITASGLRQKTSTARYHLETTTNTETGVVTRYQTSGYQPYAVNYLISQNLDPATFYYDKMKNLDVQLAYKLGGFTDKANLKILTDSISPGSTSGSQFLPTENYKIYFRTSNPVKKFYYSGVLIEKNSTVAEDGSSIAPGYRVTGYDITNPVFKMLLPKRNSNNSVKVQGSVRATVYKDYTDAVETVVYGTLFETRQDVVDFLSGYGKWLESQGFEFDRYSKEIGKTLNWDNAIDEFLYWTTQGWAAGSAITVSPGAAGFNLETKDSVIGKLKNVYNNYTVLDAGGRSISERDISVKREGNTFNIISKNENIGIYGIELHSVEKEHMLVFDNKTVFSDIIFDPETGFRQSRLKLVGWKTANWNGGFHSPGFMYDKAEVTLWNSNTDYKIGDSLEYQSRYYMAKVNHNSGAEFNASNYTGIARPTPELIPNFDYKIAQFNDFYDLETDNFDAVQQGLAQHLIGYQSRDYLNNLFVNDISQYKFYQGFIREKGTQNAINKLARAKFLDEDISLDVYPEWMVRTGEFGNVDAKKSIQFKMDDSKFLHNPQSVELLDTTNDSVNYNRSATIPSVDMYDKPLEYKASTTFAQHDYSKADTDRETVQYYKNAGYPRFDDVQHTAFNIADILNIDVDSLSNQDLIWIANNKKGDWDVLRITRTPIRLVKLQSINEGTQLEISFNTFHNFKVGDYMLVSGSKNTALNKVFEIKKSMPSKVCVNFTGNLSELSTVTDQSTVTSYGDVSKFESVRYPTIDDINDHIAFDDYKIKDETNNRSGDKVFIDNTSNYWKVYERQEWLRYNQITSPTRKHNQDFGWQVVARNDGRSMISSSPADTQGVVNFFFRKEATPGEPFTVLDTKTMTENNDSTSKLGYSLSMSSDENYVLAGAPFHNRSATGTNFDNQGLVKWYKWNSTKIEYELGGTIYPHYQQDSTTLANLNFGWDHAVAEPGENSTVRTTDKYMFISSPGANNDTGKVHMYRWSVGTDGSTFDTWKEVVEITPSETHTGHRFGHQVVVNDAGDILAVSSKAPGHAGRVHIFRRTSNTNDGSTTYDSDTWTEVQSFTGVSADGSSMNTAFGDSIAMSKDGSALIVGAPGTEVQDGSSTTFKDDAGAVYYYKWNADGSTNTYTLQQTINSPSDASNVKFGAKVNINQSGNRIIIAAQGADNPRTMKFDNGSTTFDLQDTDFVDVNREAGAVFTATKYDTMYVIDDRLINDNVSSNDQFGESVFVTDNSIFVGSPNNDAGLTADGSTTYIDDGSVAHYDTLKTGANPWELLRTETPLINNTRVESAFIFDRSHNKILDWLNYFDPLKKRIFGIADREIKYKTTWDPATYNFNTFGVADSETAWAEEHVGETWWDLSKAKWIWYEQGDQEYKTKNWGKLFPGSEVCIYEWVETTLLPSEWNGLADTQAGLADRISGIPLAIDNTKFTIKQKYDSAKDEFVNYYYFWVKNSAVVPPLGATTMIRSNSCAYVSNIITNPEKSGLRYFAVSDKNKLILWNIKDTLMNDNIVLNVDYRENDNEIDSHKVWKLYAEGDPAIRPSPALESKWWDSLTGTDSLGATVPDPNLPLNRRYGTELRPRQSWYIDRFTALKEIIQYSNSIIKSKPLIGSIKFTNLDKADPQPTKDSLEWDGSVETYADLTYVNTKDLSGNVNYLVKADETAAGFWSIYQWDAVAGIWNRTKIQTYKTNDFWTYFDWYDTGVSKDTYINKQVQYQYDLDDVELDIGQYAKVVKSDTGGWKIYEKTSTGWKNVATENGTIQLSAKLYDYTIEDSGFEGDDTYDENFFDREPIIETRNVLQALRDDIFVGDLNKEYNTLFFIGLRYVLSEQPYVNWLFKSSFLNITNSLRPLNQRKTYTTGKDDYVESYINEVKPFHTKIREYKLKYTNSETHDGINTDFDLPPFYESAQAKTRPPQPGTILDETLLTTYPYKMWKDHYTKHVKSLTITNAGSGYTKVPTISFVGGTVEDTGPFTVLGRSSSGASSGDYGYFYPVYTIQSNANTFDKQNGGQGKSHSHTFDEYPTRTFYMPNSMMNHAETTDPGTYKLFSPGTKTHATATAVISQGKLTKINLLTQGWGYTTTPEVIITGGNADGTNPTDTAKVSAVLGNDLVRDFNTTIRFDRIKSTATVQDWTANTTYEYGTLIRYNNELYMAVGMTGNARVSMTTGAKFTETNLRKLRGDESYITAAERIKGMYAPNSGMPGLELSQLMDGIDYGGVQVTGLDFNREQGFDNSPWYEDTWDGYGKSRIRTFYGDGSTAIFEFADPPNPRDVFTVYLDGVRQVNEVHRGDLSTKSFTLGSAPGDGVKVEFIPFDDDGVQTPTDDRTLDSLVSGGLFGSALGVDPNQVITDGDEFVSPDTSYAPEEAVPGQIFDTLDIQVYSAPDSGVPFIVEKNYICDGTATTFDIGQKPGTQAAVSVIVNNVAKRLATDYTVDTQAETITFGSAPTSGQRLTIKSFAISGSQYMVLNSFVGDGSTRVFKTGTRENFAPDSSLSQLYVTIDGVPTSAYATSSTANTLTLTFSSAPAVGKAIQIAGFNQTVGQGRAYAEIRQDTITYSSGNNRYTLTYPVGSYGPFAGLTVLEHGGKVLRGPDNTYYSGDGSTYAYGVDPAKTITLASQIEVFVNGTQQDLNIDYTIDFGNQQINFMTPPTATDVIAITTNIDTHYTYVGNDIILKPAQLSTDGITINNNDTIRATTFNNALGMKARREVLEGKPSGEHILDNTPLNSNFVYVWFNNQPLQQGFDYTLSGNVITIAGRTITSSDRVDVLYFSVPSSTKQTGFRLFKDMLNRQFYKRIAKSGTTTLAKDLKEGDTTITVADGSVLGDADGTTQLPGVIFIDKERIEFFQKSSNVLSQIRRGTLGTGIKAHIGGTKVVDASGKSTVPYSDTIYTNTYVSDGSTVSFATTITPSVAPAGSTEPGKPDLDIFIGGQRLLWESEDGSTKNFSISGSNVVLSNPVPANQQIKILMKKGQVWYTKGSSTASDGKGLNQSTTTAARFIAEEPTNAPE